MASSSPEQPSRKLFHVLVVGGLALAAPACSSNPAPTESDSGAEAKDGAADASDASVGFDAALDALSAADACLNRLGDCTHGLCSW